jgi:hypothetical protein
MSDHAFGDSCLRDFDSAFEQIAKNSGGAVVASLVQTDPFGMMPTVREPGARGRLQCRTAV